MNEERKAVVRYLRSMMIEAPVGEAEEHVNNVLMAIAMDISRGVHRRSKA